MTVLRAVFTHDHLVVVPRPPRAPAPGPQGALFREIGRRGTAILDLRREDDDLIADVLEPGRSDLDVRARLAAWAALTGARRLWLADDVVELEAPEALGRVALSCVVCALRIEDWTPGFWDMVRTQGFFPPTCRLCGGTFAQPEALLAPPMLPEPETTRPSAPGRTIAPQRR